MDLAVPLEQVPAWLTLPDRSTAPIGRVVSNLDRGRLLFKSLQNMRSVGRHFERSLVAQGFEIAIIRPVAGDLGDES